MIRVMCFTISVEQILGHPVHAFLPLQTECIFTVNMKLLLVSYLGNNEETWLSNLCHLLTSPFRHNGDQIT